MTPIVPVRGRCFTLRDASRAAEFGCSGEGGGKAAQGHAEGDLLAARVRHCLDAKRRDRALIVRQWNETARGQTGGKAQRGEFAVFDRQQNAG